MKILVIGGTRFIGAFTVRRLVELGNEVTVFHQGRLDNEILPAVDHIHGSILELSSHRDRFKEFGPDAVLDMIAFKTKGRGGSCRDLPRHLSESDCRQQRGCLPSLRDHPS